jgi:hypothetical protein
VKVRALCAVFGAVVALMGWPPLSAAAVTVRVHSVQQIRQDGRQVSTVSAVTVTSADGKVESTIRQGETIPDGTRIEVPAHIIVVVVSTGGKITTTLEPGSSVTFISTGQGELIASNRRKAIFSVLPRSLDFFRVRSGESITASVHGTVFWVASAAHEVSFDCKSGEVNVTRTGHILIGLARKPITLTDVLSARGKNRASYSAGSTYLAKFVTFQQAEMFYSSQIATAIRNRGGNTLGAALLNLGQVQEEGGKHAKALESYRRALAQYRQLGDRDGEAMALDDISSLR